MKIKSDFEIKKVSERYIVIPKASKNLDFSGIMTLNGSGKLLFETLQNEEKSLDELVVILTKAFEVSKDQAKTDVLVFVETLKQYDLLES